ncbi:type IVB secretion system protein IcmH/DotU [Rosenbergiella epipactidis]|uniref:type IVB secretion system protein IcmH/DotU n=1 Tax=Rosenbergiella epipactidis TaxID=1544694 RepID=UPI001F4F29FD|nr:type IVB secretion system protein IcmH/DotU [Rosenbergiella epipactidis]
MSANSDLNPKDDFSFLTGGDNAASDQALGHFLLDEAQAVNTVSVDKPTVNASSGAQLRYDAAQLRTESIQQRVATVTAASEPLLEAAQPLLRVLSEMPETLHSREQMLLLKEGLKAEISLFGVVCDEVDISWKKMAIVRFCLCTALDEAAVARAWGQEYGWAHNNLLNHFEGDSDGGNKFFLLVGRLSMTPHEYADVLEILLRILGLGFEGRYSIIDNGERHLTKIRQRMLTLLQSTRDSIPAALATHVLPLRSHKKQRLRIIPVRVSILLTLVLCSGSFMGYKYLLLQRESYELTKIRELHPSQQSPRSIVTVLRFSDLLKDEITKRLLQVKEQANQSIITLPGDSNFAVGATEIMPARIELLKKIAHAVERVHGKVRIIGYTDAMPISRPGVPDNQVLSEKRADSVAQVFLKAGLPKADVQRAGMGESNPVASNLNPAGRAQNRRVDIIVNY